MYGSQGTRMGALLSLRGARAGGAFWSGEDTARGKDEDVAVGEFLFEFAG